MESAFLTSASATYGIIFAGVLAEFVGVPFPSSLLLIFAGALSYEEPFDPILILIVALGAASIGDALWFTLGKKRGAFLLKGYCRISLGSEDCVRRTKEFFLRFPGPSLVVGKFVPGLSAFVVPLAGLSGMRYSRFLGFDAAGIFLWVSSMVGLGYWGGESFATAMANVTVSRWVLAVVAAIFLGGFYAIKLLRLKRFGRAKLIDAREMEIQVAGSS